MKFTDGMEVIVTLGNTKRHGKIMATQPKDGTYLVSVDHGNGGFHYIPEDRVQAVEDVDPQEITVRPGRVPSWY